MKVLTTCLAVILCICSFAVTAQSPGGVEEPIIWCSTEKDNEGNFFWENRLPSSNPIQESDGLLTPKEGKFLNFNEGLNFSENTHGLVLSLAGQDLSKSTFFTVFYPVDSLEERNVWSLEKNNRDYLVLSSHRLGDMDELQYMNFVGYNKESPSINSYIQYKKQDSIQATSQELYVGGLPSNQELPLTTFKGIIPEIIIYDRVLSPIEQAKVETYLAIKYGLAINEFEHAVYVSSLGDTLWSKRSNYPYVSNITGIGKDNYSGLNQKQSSSSYESGVLTIGVNEITTDNTANNSSIPDHSFLIWGDDNGELSLDEEKIGQPQFFNRTWKLTSSGFTNEIETEVRYNTEEFDDRAPRGMIYWLVVDESGKGVFSKEEVRYISQQKSLNDTVFFQNITWDNNNSRKDVFTLAIGPEMMPVFWLDQPICAVQEQGTIHIKAIGGQGPYRFNLQNADNGFSQTWEDEQSNLVSITGIDPGDYTLHLTDNLGHEYTETFFIQSSDAPVLSLESSYSLRQGETIYLDARTGDLNSTSYQWTSPNGETLFNPDIAITSPGVYQLTMIDRGCESRYEINVAAFEEDIFKQVQLFPNPVAKGGLFQADIALKRIAEMEVYIRDISGKLITSRMLQGEKAYQFKYRIESPGIYSITLVSEDIQRSYKLIVN